MRSLLRCGLECGHLQRQRDQAARSIRSFLKAVSHQRRSIMILKAVGLAVSSVLLGSVHALAAPQPIIEELFTANRTLGGQVVSYPDETPEMRVYRITIPVNAKISLHIHPSLVVDVVEQGRRINVRVLNGVEVAETLEAGDGFLEGHPEEPHYVVNRGSKLAVSLVTYASVEGMLNQILVMPNFRK